MFFHPCRDRISLIARWSPINGEFSQTRHIPNSTQGVRIVKWACRRLSMQSFMNRLVNHRRIPGAHLLQAISAMTFDFGCLL